MLGRLQRPVGPTARPQRGAAARRIVVSVRASGAPINGQKFDYVIVGGGTAGCVLANKLTADGKTNVLMLEAGGDGESLEVAVPAGLSRLFGHPVLDWGLKSGMQKQLNSREIYLARGRLLGGSSCTNATLYHRGSAADYDGWNLDGWRSQDVLEWFMAAENNKNGADKYHGATGTMHVENPKYDNKLHEAFFRAAEAAGIKPNPDFNDWSRPQSGYGEFQVSHKNGERADMYRMYLKPALSRGNLKVVKGARTTKVQMERGSKGVRACGVDFNIGGEFGEKYTAELAPNGEVLMCTGAVHTPQLLMLSGVGPARQLSEHGIQAVVDNAAVGANLQDHPACLVASLMKADQPWDLTITGQIYSQSSKLRPSAVLQYIFGRNGPLASTGCDHGAFVSTTGNANQADLQIRFVPGCSLDPDGVGAYIKFGELQKQGQAWPSGVTLQLLAIRAKSKGSVGLRTADPFSPPEISPNYFTQEADLATLKAGVRLARDIISQQPLASYLQGDGASILIPNTPLMYDHQEEKFPGSKLQSDSDLEAYIRKTVHSGNALVGTARMGRSIQDNAVVSSNDLRVFGVEGLRVVDASVLPAIPGGQTGAATVMVAERAAALLARGAAEGSFRESPARVAVPA